jgi:hypothetical protein
VNALQAATAFCALFEREKAGDEQQEEEEEEEEKIEI